MNNNSMVETTLQDNQLYHRHLKGQCICLTCQCGQCRCPFSRKLLQTHLKARSLYQQEYTPKQRSTSMTLNPGQFPYQSQKLPLEVFNIKHQFQPGQLSESLKPLIFDKPKLEEFGQSTSYERQFKAHRIEPQELIKPINSLFLVKNIPNLYKSNYKANYKVFRPTEKIFDGPMKSRKGLIGCGDISFHNTSKYQDEYQNYKNDFPRQSSHNIVPYLKLGSYKGQFDTSSKRSFQPFTQSLCPAKQELSLHEQQYSNEKYKMHL